LYLGLGRYKDEVEEDAPRTSRTERKKTTKQQVLETETVERMSQEHRRDAEESAEMGWEDGLLNKNKESNAINVW
jgi:hypothetical protein